MSTVEETMLVTGFSVPPAAVGMPGFCRCTQGCVAVVPHWFGEAVSWFRLGSVGAEQFWWLGFLVLVAGHLGIYWGPWSLVLDEN
eukprot:12951274-Ditylum_brightwellii.AAC.1